METHLQKLKQEQELILNQVDNAIALFDRVGRLALFNRKITQIWEVSSDWLTQQPHSQELFAHLVTQGYFSPDQCQQIQQLLQQAETENALFFYLEQPNGTCLEICVTVTWDGGHLLMLRDVTSYQQLWRDGQITQASLNAEIQRQQFLLGLTELLQPASELKEIGQFALSYFIETMEAAFGDIKVITGEGLELQASILTNYISAQFIAIYGEPIIAEMEAVLQQGIPYGQGLLWDVVRTGEPLFIEDYYNHPKAVPTFRHPGITHLGIFPIPGADGSIIGTLTLESRGLVKIQEAPQQDMVLAACRILGVAIERAEAQAHLRQMNEDLKRASQMKSEFLASMSHELRTPLNSILGFSDLLLRQINCSLTDRQISYVQTIERSGQHLLQLINDILDLSKIEAGKTELNLKPVSIPVLCQESLKMMQARADQKRLMLLLELDAQIWQMTLDERRVYQMLINLLSNAVKFTPAGGRIKLSSRMADGSQLLQEYRPDRSPIDPTTPYLCLEVQDSGIGIPQDQWHLLFRPFQQVDTSLTRRHEGTGLGLALTKRLAELHGGTVSLESAENQGSAFRIWLPLVDWQPESGESSQFAVSSSPLGETATENSKAESQNPIRVLVVEDNPYNQALMTAVLEMEGYMVELIDDGGIMQEMIHSPLVTPQSLPGAIVMDIQLPKVNGFELLRQLKAHSLWQQVPVVAVTAMAMVGDRDRCLAAGANAYLCKPLNFDQLTATLRTLLHQS